MPRLEDDQMSRIARADLRYTNGFALTWRAPPQPEAMHESQG
jgi:cell division septal protein FtsQ